VANPYNTVVLIGRLTSDPEMSYTPQGVASVTFRLAVKRTVKNKDGKYDADFISCKAWRATAEVIGNHARKGRMVSVVGSIRVYSYEKSGERRTGFEIECDNVQLMDAPGGKTGEATPGRQSASAEADADFPDDFYPDDLPY